MVALSILLTGRYEASESNCVIVFVCLVSLTAIVFEPAQFMGQEGILFAKVESSVRIAHSSRKWTAQLQRSRR